MGKITRTNFGLRKRIRISHAQILTLPTLSVEVLPPTPAGSGPGGSDQIWMPLSVIVWCNPLVADYTNIDAACSLASSYMTFFGGGAIVNVIAGGAARAALGLVGEVIPSVVVNPFNEFRIRITNGGSGNLTGGDPANVMHVVCDYTEISPLL